MKKRKLLLSVVLLMAIIISGCSNKVAPTATSSNELNYGFKEDKAYSYVNRTDMSQILEYGGQEISVIVESTLAFTAKKKNSSESNIDLAIRIDSIQTVAKSMAGDMVSKPDEIKGKEFGLSISLKGEPENLDEAEKLSYASIGNQQTNMKNSFLMMFPDLPGGNAIIGFTWTDNDTLNIEEGGQQVSMIMKSDNTITGKETIMGYECLKIDYVVDGERITSGNTAEGYMTSSGSMKGSGYMYFAPREGVLVKDYTKTKFEGELTIPTGDSLPMEMNIEITTELMK